MIAVAFCEQELVWTITGIGVVRPHFDRIMIASTATKAELLASLPMKELKAASYSFNVKEKRHWKFFYKSTIGLDFAADNVPLRILLDNEALLGTYSVTVLEISADVDVRSEDELLISLVDRKLPSTG